MIGACIRLGIGLETAGRTRGRRHRCRIPHPGLSFDDAPAAIDWLCRVFGFTKRLVVPGPDGTVVHSELSLGPGVIMVSSPRPEQGRVPNVAIARSPTKSRSREPGARG